MPDTLPKSNAPMRATKEMGLANTEGKQIESCRFAERQTDKPVHSLNAAEVQLQFKSKEHVAKTDKESVASDSNAQQCEFEKHGDLLVG